MRYMDNFEYFFELDDSLIGRCPWPNPVAPTCGYKVNYLDPPSEEILNLPSNVISDEDKRRLRRYDWEKVNHLNGIHRNIMLAHVMEHFEEIGLVYHSPTVTAPTVLLIAIC